MYNKGLQIRMGCSNDPDIHIHPLFVESSAPDWVPPVTYETFASILPAVAGRRPHAARAGV